MMTDELPPDLEDPAGESPEVARPDNLSRVTGAGQFQDDEPELDDPPGHDSYPVTESESVIGFDNEAERAHLRPVNGEHQYGYGAPNSGYDEDWRDPYRSLGGLARPDAYYGAIEFDCPTCQAKAKTLDFDGEKCRVFHERLDRWINKKCPCVKRIQLAKKAGIL